ncbi:MAG: hypothetical protein ACK5O2_06520 [Microthrixaceae bacterium]
MPRARVVADFEAFFSRPVAPTRRIALGSLGFPNSGTDNVNESTRRVALASMLLGGVVATFGPALDEDDTVDLHRLIDDIDGGRRVPQPRLRHRFQRDRVGLKRSVNRLVEVDASALDPRAMFRLEVDRTNGTATQHCLAAVYCARTAPASARSRVCAALRVGLAWAGTPGEDLLAVLRVGSIHGDWAGVSVDDPVLGVSADPVGWALDLLGLTGTESAVGRRTVQRAFRSALRDAHPDHGAPIDGAAQRIAELNTARRILLG